MNDIDLPEIDLHETSKGTTPTEQTLALRDTPLRSNCLNSFKSLVVNCGFCI